VPLPQRNDGVRPQSQSNDGVRPHWEHVAYEVNTRTNDSGLTVGGDKRGPVFACQ